jgi:hypothetical protein
MVLMSATDGVAAVRRQFPATPNLEHLKKQAKARLRDMRSIAPAATLAQAQFAVARDYGFASWRALKGAIAPKLAHLTGHYRRDPNVIADSILTVTSRGVQLFVQGVGGAKIPLVAVAPGVFTVTDTAESYRFEGPPGGAAERIVIGSGFKTIEALRADARALREAEAAFARALADQSRPRTRVELDPDTLRDYAGSYASPLGAVVEVAPSGNRLLVGVNGQPPMEILPEGPECFFFPEASTQISFRMRDGRAEALAVHQMGRVLICPRASVGAASEFVKAIKQRYAEQERQRAPVMILSEETLKRYVGRYELEQTTALTVTMDGGRLFGAFSGQSRFELFAETEAAFQTISAVKISFIENAIGRIDRALLHQVCVDLVLMRERTEVASTPCTMQGAQR